VSDDYSVEAVESERAQIANEIHDSLLPLIVGAKAAVESYLQSSTSSHGDHDTLQQALKWLKQASSAGRDLLTLTYPPELDRTDWLVAAKHVADSLLSEKNSIAWQIDPVCHDYEKPIASAAYRIVVEAIRNAVRHSGATEITVAADLKQVTITDNGSGFDPTAVEEGHFGIRSMKARASLAGGELLIDSRPGKSTAIVFQVPTMIVERQPR
jgi:signal transduction histidine kinase